MKHRKGPYIVFTLSMTTQFQQSVDFLLEGVGGLPKNDREFPFAGDVELLRGSLTGSHGW